MSFIEANITIDLPDGVDPTPIIEEIRRIMSNSNGNATRVSVIEVDDPVSNNPILISKMLGA